MDIKDKLAERSFEDLVEFGADLVEADDRLLWALIQARKDAGYTQTEFAELLGIKQSTLSKFEGPESDPRLSTIRRYARTLGARISHTVVAPTGQTYDCSAGWRIVNWESRPGDGQRFTLVEPAARSLYELGETTFEDPLVS